MKLTGKYLLSLGLAPGKVFGEVLRHFNGAEHSFTEEDVKEMYYSRAKEEEDSKVTLSENPVPYDIFLDEGDSPYDKANREAVIRTMDEAMRSPFVVGGAIMPDACPAGPVGTIPVGGVITTKGTVVPGFHSSDVCCSMNAVYFVSGASNKVLMDIAEEVTHFGPGINKTAQFTPTRFDNYLKHLELEVRENKFTRGLEDLYYGGIATQGDGNHFLTIGDSKYTGCRVMVTHHGSRGFGHHVFKRGLEAAQKYTNKVSKGVPKGNSFLSLDTEEGQEYMRALNIVKEWTYINHAMLGELLLIELTSNGYEPHVIQKIFNPHNFVFQEGDLVHHAKGSTPMVGGLETGQEFMGDRRIIPLNMGANILIVEENPKSPSKFAPHGAGRNMSRTEFLKYGPPPSDVLGSLDARFYSGKPDYSEYPSAYKDPEFVKQQIEKYKLAEIVDEVIPFGSIMAGAR